ncbi:tyrosine-type recombinase/integrase [Microvirga sp. STR05]|uniref:Tyrosine-type recombinase/integrase n=1 Tax=Hymenobacter duratus TaxID=2771356 RepID=A0ABR8JN00_9BACT|nr:site-specific integrase [Hymenobacter duratus]MBD2716747.1 tyrosine-type recombinase/integrase [Hymenobacter duratus]MBR7951662.1 tyrosine-type recombinase/integrase [Microvirga sp. STR05]
MVTQFTLRTDKKDSTGRCPVHLVVYFDGLRLRCATGEKCKPADWNTERQQFRRSYPLADEANDLLKLMAGNVLAWWRTTRAAGETPTVAGLKAALRPAPAPTPASERLVVEEIMQFREVMRRRGLMLNTLRHYLVTANWLRDFEKWAGRSLTVSGYDLATHDLVLAYLRHERELSPNSLYTVGKDLRRLFGYLRDERELPISVEPRKLRVACQDTEKVYLTAPELERLRVTVLPTTLAPVRDVFLFCCYTGLRYSDVLQLHGGNVEALPDGSGRVLRLTQTKTRTRVSVYLTAAASTLLEKYAGPEREGVGARLLPVYQNQVMNRYLKRICQLAGVTAGVEVVEVRAGQVIKSMRPKHELVTMHTARHTFATQSLLRGMPVEVLQKILGHASIKTTLVYAKIVEDFQHQTMRRIWDDAPTPAPVAAETICTVQSSAA